MADFFYGLFHWFRDIENWQSLATVLSGFSTPVIAVLTYYLWRENRALRKAGSEPRLVAYYEPHPDGTGGLNITIANVGQGPARNVYFQFQDEHKELSKYNLILDCTLRRGPISVIPQGEKISIFFAIGYQLFKPNNFKDEKPISPFYIQLEWQTLQGRNKNTERFLLDVQPYADLPGFVNKPYLLKLVDSVDKVEKQIGALKPMVGRLANLIEASTLESRMTKKVKGNTEDV